MITYWNWWSTHTKGTIP